MTKGTEVTDAYYDPKGWQKLPEYGRLQQAQPLLDSVFVAILKEEVMEGESVLDVGCGAGRLAFHFDSGYTGIDITPSYIELAKKKFPNLTWVEGDCRKLPFPDQSFDRTWSSNLLIHLAWDDIRLALKEMARVTRKAIYLCSLFGERGEIQVISSDRTNYLPFIYNQIPYDYIDLPGWEMEMVEDGSHYLIFRKT